MTTPATTERNRLITDAAGFRSRDRRDRPILLRFTAAELALLDALAAEADEPRVDTIRRLIAAGLTNAPRRRPGGRP